MYSHSHSVMDYVNQAMKRLENDYRTVLDQTHVIQLELRALKAENDKRDAERREFQKQVLELLDVGQKTSNAEVEFSRMFKSKNGEKKENMNVTNWENCSRKDPDDLIEKGEHVQRSQGFGDTEYNSKNKRNGDTVTSNKVFNGAITGVGPKGWKSEFTVHSSSSSKNPPHFSSKGFGVSEYELKSKRNGDTISGNLVFDDLIDSVAHKRSKVESSLNSSRSSKNVSPSITKVNLVNLNYAIYYIFL
ncbi:hypothetical protein TorRG33x02_035750 [Trema orientale]|uniref:Uncharacterized protein n=1 Tax=Trema orientale TaxID=63057 RepID=A0A2P5FRU7_TREOI|nr:hypothetical protein TorRG33x02_035750 [Trema orientale]